MNKLERQVNALMRLCTAEDNDSYEAAKREVKRLMACPGRGDEKTLDIENEIQNLLLELGVPDHLAGYPYLARAILMVVKDRKQILDICGPDGLYRKLAREFDATHTRVERAIRHCVETAWTRCDLDVLGRYFGNIIDPAKGKSTNSEFIARVANVIRMRMKQ